MTGQEARALIARLTLPEKWALYQLTSAIITEREATE